MKIFVSSTALLSSLVSKSYERVSENNNNMGKVQLCFQCLEEKLACRYFFSMSDDLESHRESESNDLLRAQADVKNYFRCSNCIPFKNNAKKTI